MSVQPSAAGNTAFIEKAIIASMLGGALLVLIGTRGRHPGWIGLLGVAILVWLG